GSESPRASALDARYGPIIPEQGRWRVEGIAHQGFFRTGAPCGDWVHYFPLGGGFRRAPFRNSSRGYGSNVGPAGRVVAVLENGPNDGAGNRTEGISDDSGQAARWWRTLFGRWGYSGRFGGPDWSGIGQGGRGRQD